MDVKHHDYLLSISSELKSCVKVEVNVLGRRFESTLRLSLHFKSYDLWTPSCDFAPHNERDVKIALIAAHVNAESSSSPG